MKDINFKKMTCIFCIISVVVALPFIADYAVKKLNIRIGNGRMVITPPYDRYEKLLEHNKYYLSQHNKEIAPVIPVENDIHFLYGVNLPNNQANVFVSIKNKPITLFLSSAQPINWKVTTEKGVIIDKIILAGQDNQTVEMKNSNPKTFKYKDSVCNNTFFTESTALYCLEKIQELTGKTPKTIQSERNGEFLVDGYKTFKLKQEPDNYDEIQYQYHRPVKLERYDGCRISNDGLGIKYSSRSGAGFATRSYNKGKWYYEALLKVRFFGIHPGNQAEIGISASDVSYSGIYDAMDWDNLSHNDIIGVALDLDNSRLYFALNGRWLNGDPSKGIDGWKIKKNRYYRAVVVVDSPDMESGFGSDSWRLNFGGKQFKYTIPKDYKAYGAVL